MNLFSKKNKKQFEKTFGKKDVMHIIQEWDNAGNMLYNEKVERALIDMREDVVNEIAKFKELDLSIDLKQQKIIKFVFEKLKEKKIIDVKFRDELEKKDRFKLTLNAWSDAIKGIWELKDKISGAKGVLIYCYDWENKMCDLIPLETNEAIFLHLENREMFYLSNPFISINGLPCFFVLRGLMFSYRLEINVDGFKNFKNRDVESIPIEFIAQLNQMGSRPMFTMFKAAVLDRFAGVPRTFLDKFKAFIIPFALGAMSTAVIMMPMIQMAGGGE